MSVERAVSPARAPRPLRAIALLTLLVAALAAGGILVLMRPFHTWETAFAESPDRTRVAFARSRSCADGPCQTLWVGASRNKADKVGSLDPKLSHCDEIAWTPDGKRVAFLIDGYQLRFYDAERLLPAGQINLIQPDATPTSRIARGITFSENGRAVTFDDCPRRHSGCRASLAAVPIPETR